MNLPLQSSSLPITTTMAASLFCMAVNNMLASTTAFHLASPVVTPLACRQSNKSSRMPLCMSSEHMPNEQERAKQKSEAYNALSSFHETSSSFAGGSKSFSTFKDLAGDIGAIMSTIEEEMGGGASKTPMADYWECTKGAITYVVPMDPAAGLKRGMESKPYKTSVQVEMDLDGLLSGRGEGGRQLRLHETFQFSDSIPFSRSVPLGANFDVDSVDGSYSLDDSNPVISNMNKNYDEEASATPSLPLLPPSLLPNRMDPTSIRFLVEHTLAVSETERVRCFLLYGDADGGNDNYDDDDNNIERNYRLMGVVLADEAKVMANEQQDISSDSDAIVESVYEVTDAQSTSIAESSSSPLDLIESKDKKSETKEEQMKRLMETLEKHNKQVLADASSAGEKIEDEKYQSIERHSLGLYGLTSGAFLGDAMIREIIPSKGQTSRIRQQRQGKGFGKTAKNAAADNQEDDGFANWVMGVQKVALQYKWDYSESITQSYEWGRSLGTSTSLSCGANRRSDGRIVVNEGGRLATMKGVEPRVIWDVDGGMYVAGLIGSSYFRAPRYMSFSRVRSYNHEPFLTEFMSFFRLPENSSFLAATSESGDIEGPGYYCSRISRLYNAHDGSLMQGSTAFFAMGQNFSEPSKSSSDELV